MRAHMMRLHASARCSGSSIHVDAAPGWHAPPLLPPPSPPGFRYTRSLCPPAEYTHTTPTRSGARRPLGARQDTYIGGKARSVSLQVSGQTHRLLLLISWAYCAGVNSAVLHGKGRACIGVAASRTAGTNRYSPAKPSKRIPVCCPCVARTQGRLLLRQLPRPWVLGECDWPACASRAGRPWGGKCASHRGASARVTGGASARVTHQSVACTEAERTIRWRVHRAGNGRE